MTNGFGMSIEEGMKNFVEFISKYYKYFNGDIIIGMDHLDIDSMWINYYLDIAGYEPLHKLFGMFLNYIYLIFKRKIGIYD